MVKVETVVFISLVLDLFAFTIPLPLFPRLIEWYTLVSSFYYTIRNTPLNTSKREIGDPNGFLSRTLQFVSSLRSIFYKPTSHSSRWDVVLLGERIPYALVLPAVSQDI